MFQGKGTAGSEAETGTDMEPGAFEEQLEARCGHSKARGDRGQIRQGLLELVKELGATGRLGAGRCQDLHDILERSPWLLFGEWMGAAGWSESKGINNSHNHPFPAHPPGSL